MLLLNHDLFWPNLQWTGQYFAALTSKIIQHMTKTSLSTTSLKARIQELLKNRGSMAVEEAKLFEDILYYLEEQEPAKTSPQPVTKQQRLLNAGNALFLLWRVLTDPHISDGLKKLIDELIEKLT